MTPPRWRWLPAEGSWRYHLLLAAAGMLVLGPLAGVTAAYMNFSLGFFVGGQVLAGLLGSAVTAGYGAQGKHGANYIQTAAASVASMSGMGVLVQAMVWMGLPQPPAWHLVAYFVCSFFLIRAAIRFEPENSELTPALQRPWCAHTWRSRSSTTARSPCTAPGWQRSGA